MWRLFLSRDIEGAAPRAPQEAVAHRQPAGGGHPLPAPRRTDDAAAHALLGPEGGCRGLVLYHGARAIPWCSCHTMVLVPYHCMIRTESGDRDSSTVHSIVGSGGRRSTSSTTTSWCGCAPCRSRSRRRRTGRSSGNSTRVSGRALARVMADSGLAGIGLYALRVLVTHVCCVCRSILS
jgi:hypothetical protein